MFDTLHRLHDYVAFGGSGRRRPDSQRAAASRANHMRADVCGLRPRVEQMILNRPTLNFTSLLAQPFGGERLSHKSKSYIKKCLTQLYTVSPNFRHTKTSTGLTRF
jgi:hypothetical protein